MRFYRVLLALEVLFGALPITIVGGGYSLFGVVFGSASVLMALREFSFNALALWLGILGLAASGCVGIVGLWALIALSAGFRPESARLRKVARVGSVIGVLAAGVALVLVFNVAVDRRPLVVYILVAPILVVVHRYPGLKSHPGVSGLNRCAI